MGLPTGYESPKKESKYLNKFEQGSTKFQVLAEDPENAFIWGWQIWHDHKPIRQMTMKDMPTGDIGFDGNESEPEFFWSMVIWNITLNKLQILNVTKRQIQKQIESFIDSDWGNICNMCLEVKREGQQLETRYTVIPTRLKKVPSEIMQEFELLDIDLTLLFDGKDPFKKEGDTIDPDSVPF